MNKKLNLAISLFSPHLLWELAFVIQIVSFFACSVVMISNFVQQQYIYHSFSKVFTEECVYFQPYDRLVDIFMDPNTSPSTCRKLSEKVQKYAKEIAPNGEIGTIVYTIGESENQLIKVAGYNWTMAKYIGIDTDAFLPEKFDDPKLPVLIRGALCDQYSIGDNFAVTVGDDMAPLSVVVVGELASDFQLIVPSYGASDPAIDSFFASDIISDDPLENENSIIFCYSDNEDWLANLINPACFIFVGNETIARDKLHEQLGAVGGKFFMMDELIDNTITQNIYRNREPLSKVFASSVFMLISLFGYVFLLFIRNRRTLGIYTILGMSRKCMYAVILSAIGLCVSVATVLYVAFSTIATRIGLYFISDTNIIVIVYSICLVFTSILAGTLTCSLFIYRWQPIQYLKGE